MATYRPIRSVKKMHIFPLFYINSVYMIMDCFRVGDLVQKHFCYAGWKSLHIQTAINKLSGIYVFIICGRRRTIKRSSNHIPRSEGYVVLTACQLMYLHTSAHRLLRYYTLCTVMFSHWCLRHEVIWQHCIQPSANTVSHHAAGLPLVSRWSAGAW